MNTRFKEIRKSLNLTQEEFSSKIGLSRNYIAQIELGSRVPSDRTISDICRIFSVNKEWLLNGVGEPYVYAEDERAGYISDLLEGKDDEFCDLIIEIMKTYSGLGEKEKNVLRNFAKELAKNLEGRN